MPGQAPIDIPRRSAIARAHKERGGRIAAVLPIHYPRALLRAFDFLPMEVWGPPGIDPSLGTAHLQPYVCSIVRNTLAFLQSGGLEVADVVIVPHGCDSLQGLGSILIDFVQPRQPVIPLYLPRGNGDSGIRFLADEARSVYRRLEKITRRSPSEEELTACIVREEAADALLVHLHHRRRSLALSDSELYRVIRSREYVPAERFCEIAQAALDRPTAAPRAGIPIVLSGILPEPYNLIEAISTMGAAIVADDLACCGRRLYPPGRSEDPFQRMAESILWAPPDSTRGSAIRPRIEHLLRLATESGARGVVFYGVKFCEPELFSQPDLRRGLQEAGIPSVVLETDISDALSQQAMTRIEAFLEMIT
jgi:benzoyl-CoA reductase/2-hydroxyglutaryl-CoA dehydratase subunit BcrC/BadD/HgdB